VDRRDGRAAAGIGLHDFAEVVDGRGNELAREAAELAVGIGGQRSLVVELVMDDEGSDRFDQVEGRADALQEGFADGAAGGLVAVADPAHAAVAFGVGGRLRFSEIVGEDGKREQD